MSIARYALLALAAFELLPLYRLLVVGEALHTVAPVFSPITSSHDSVLIFSWVLAMLSLVRVGAFAAGQSLSRPVKLMVVAVHALEVPFYASLYLRNVYPRRNLMASAMW